MALACLVLGLIVAVPAANAASTTQILRDCADDGVLQGDYTPAELRRARQRIPADTDQYTDCRDVLARAASQSVTGASGGSVAGGDGSGGGGGGGERLTPADDTERSALEEAARDGGSAVDIGGTKVVPGAAGLRAGAARNGLPPTLTALLILLGIAALSTMAPGAQRAWGAVGGRFRTHVLRHD